MTWHAQAVLMLALPYLVVASCFGRSDDCSFNPIPLRRVNPDNFHTYTCNLKWKNGCTTPDKYGGKQQKPPPFQLCNTHNKPSGLLEIDGYTLALQRNESTSVSSGYTLHGLWPGSRKGSGETNQPYGCLNGEEFDETILATFHTLLNHFWPTNPKYNNTMQCFILSEWMKHGTCAVIPGADGEAFRIPQETYYRTAFVLANEVNANTALQEHLKLSDSSTSLEPIVSTNCVQCAYLAAERWTDTEVSSVPRMSEDCVGQCFACGNYWDICTPAHLDSTVLLNPNNAPLMETESGNASVPLLKYSFPGLTSGHDVSPWEGTWRSFGAEQLGSGKFEFAQSFSDNVLTVTTDSPYPQTCTYERRGSGELALRCGPKHSEECLVQRMPDIGGLEVAFLACNHTGAPAPASFYTAMDTPGCGNFLMFRCKSSKEGCAFSPDTISATGSKASESAITVESKSKPNHVSHYQPGIAGAPPTLLGSWRTLQASLRWPNYPSRGVERYSVSHSHNDPSLVLLAKSDGTITTCHFHFQYQQVYSYAVLNCDDSGGDKEVAHTKWAMGRCNPCSAHCRYSCNSENDFCGAGSCDPADSEHASSPGALPSPSHENTGKASHNWCTPEDSSCWPTKTAIRKLEQALDPSVPRLGLRWDSYPQPQPAPVPTGSINNQSFYGLGNKPEGLRALYHYEDVTEMQRPCFSSDGNPATWNIASDMCKAALHQNEYRNWNPFIVVFPLNERHIVTALKFAARHRLCIATAGTGHEYNSRNSCPTGGILIRTILLKDKTFLPTWHEDEALAPVGAFRFGAGSIFAEMHAFSAENRRAVASGWCSTVGMVGYHLGGGHGPFAPSMGLGVDNLLEIEVLQVGRDAHGQPIVHKKIASRRQNPQLFWAMRGGGGGVWGVILSMTVRAHAIPDGGFSRVFIPQNGTFCPDSRPFGYEWLRSMWPRFSAWQLMLNQKVSTQPGFFINTTNYEKEGLCGVTWQFNFEYIYAGGQEEPDYILFRDRLKDVLQAETVQERNFKTAYDYLLFMPADKFQLAVTNPLPASHPPSDTATGSQNSVFVSRQAMEKEFASTMMDVLDICVASLKKPDMTSPDSAHHRCGFHYLYTSVTGNLGSSQPDDTAISHGFRLALMLWNARTLTTQQCKDTIYKLGPNTYFSESSYVMHNWTTRYWGQKKYEQLLAIKKAHDPGNHFWCHHCIGDDPNDAYGEPLGAAGRFVTEEEVKQQHVLAE
ncbi:hypothetical protein FGRMN_10482 [Fusarium graminum]|nr:hypothetical protein FGRMN_10482 [Fusarium graminum]